MPSPSDELLIRTIWEAPPTESLPHLRALWWSMRREGMILRPEPGVIIMDGGER